MTVYLFYIYGSVRSISNLYFFKFGISPNACLIDIDIVFNNFKLELNLSVAVNGIISSVSIAGIEGKHF